MRAERGCDWWKVSARAHCVHVRAVGRPGEQVPTDALLVGLRASGSGADSTTDRDTGYDRSMRPHYTRLHTVRLSFVRYIRRYTKCVLMD